MPDERPKTNEAKRREERRAAALRENLRRRKAQARSLSDKAGNTDKLAD